MNAIEFRNVTLTLGGRAVLAGVSLKVAPREFVGVLGPNGAGKTTLMRAVLGLLPASRGSIHVLGRPAVRGNQMVGYMPQVRSLAGMMRLNGMDTGWACRSWARRLEPKSIEFSIWSVPASWRVARWPRRPAASGSACCWPKR
jgi:energy-coupling factor transporter ATP-binding protein EcfA2